MEQAFFRLSYVCCLNCSINQKPKFKTMLDKILKNSKLMGVLAIATFAIVAYVLVYKPWKATQQPATV